MERAERVELLMKRIREFAAQNSRWETQAGAFLQCDTASLKFLEWLSAKDKMRLDIDWYYFDCRGEGHEGDGYNPKPDFYVGSGTRNDQMGERQSDGHCILANPDFFVDFTARQYWSTAAYPLLIPRAGYLSMSAAAGTTE